MKSGISNAGMLLGLAVVSLLSWAASHNPGPSAGHAAPAPAPSPSLAPAPACLASQLSLAFLTGQPNGGHNFGIIAIWDSSAARCSLTGPILVTGLDKAGHPQTARLRYLVAGQGQLTARGTRPGPGMQLIAGQREAPLIVSSMYSLDPANRYRRCTRRVEPASWRLTFASGGVLTIANADPHAAAGHVRGLPADHGLLTCRDELDVPEPISIPAS